MKNAELTGMASTAQSSGVIKHLRLYDITFIDDKPEEGCTAIAAVTQRGLQRKVQNKNFLLKR